MLYAQNWQTDFKKAKAIATSENKNIILVFQGSDWCAPCIKLDKEVWASEAFKDYAGNHFVMLQADFPRKKKNQLPEEQQEANAQLAATYNKKGIFPFVLILDCEGTILGQTGYSNISVTEYIKMFDPFKL